MTGCAGGRRSRAIGTPSSCSKERSNMRSRSRWRSRTRRCRTLVWPWGSGCPLRAADDVEPQLDPAVNLTVLHPQPVRARRECRIVHLGLVRRPVVDNEGAVDPHPHPLVADRTNGIDARRQSGGARCNDPPMIARQEREQARSAIPHKVELGLTSRGRPRVGQSLRDDQAGAAGCAGIVPGKEIQMPTDRGLEAFVGEAPAATFEGDRPITDRVRTWSYRNRVADVTGLAGQRGNTALRDNMPAPGRAERSEPQRNGAGRVDGPELGRAPGIGAPLIDDNCRTVAETKRRRRRTAGDGGRRRRRGRTDSIHAGRVANGHSRLISQKLVSEDAVIAAAGVVVLRIAPIRRRNRVGPQANGSRVVVEAVLGDRIVLAVLARDPSAVAVKIVAADLGFVAVSAPDTVLTAPRAIPDDLVA